MYEIHTYFDSCVPASVPYRSRGFRCNETDDRSLRRISVLAPCVHVITYLWSICTCRNMSRHRTGASDTFCRRSSRPAPAPCTIRRRSACRGIAFETRTDRGSAAVAALSSLSPPPPPPSHNRWRFCFRRYRLSPPPHATTIVHHSNYPLFVVFLATKMFFCAIHNNINQLIFTEITGFLMPFAVRGKIQICFAFDSIKTTIRSDTSANRVVHQPTANFFTSRNISKRYLT